jgi:hypothetical protein
MFSERGLKEGQTAKDFFSRKKPKPTYATSKKESADWLKNAKALYLTHVQKVAPDFVPTPKGEPKIGPKLQNASRTKYMIGSTFSLARFHFYLIFLIPKQFNLLKKSLSIR